MAALNIVNVATITGKTALALLSTDTANVVTNSSGSSAVAKIENIILSNYSNNAVTANVGFNRSSVFYSVGGGVSIPSRSTLVLLAKDTSVYMEEGDVLQASTSANSSLHITVGYELMS